MSKVFDSWEKATDENKATYILSDFNKNWFNDEDSASMRYYANICCLTQVVEQSTRTVRTASYNASSCLDLIFTNRAEHGLFKCKVFEICFRLCSHDAGTKKCRLISSPFCIVYTIPVQFKLSVISTGVHTILNRIRHFNYCI